MPRIKLTERSRKSRQREEFERKLAEQRRQFEDELAALRGGCDHELDHRRS
jgi:hypothetical protein